MEFSSMIFYPLEIAEQINYLSGISKASGQGLTIRGSKSPYSGAEALLAVANSLDGKTDQLKFSIEKVESFIQEEKAYTKENGKVRLYGDEEKLGFFLVQDAFTYGGK